MIKRDELADPNSCLNKARDDERMFILLARDAAAPRAIQEWCEERIRIGKNKGGDDQIREAMMCAALMRRERVERAVERADNEETRVTGVSKIVAAALRSYDQAQRHGVSAGPTAARIDFEQALREELLR